MSEPILEHSAETPLRAVLFEAEQHQQSLQRSLGMINLVSASELLLGSLLLLLFAFPGLEVRQDWLAAVIVVVMCAGGLVLNFHWVEAISLLRYKYIVLYPRLFSVVGQQRWMNYLEFTAPRSLRSWMPILYYNLVAFTVLAGLWLRFLLVPAVAHKSAEAWGLCAIAVLSLLATLKTAYLAILAARTLERDIKFALGRTWNPPPPFLSPLRLIPCGDGQSFMVDLPFTVSVRRHGSSDPVVIEVPGGFFTDLTSVPQPLWPLFPPWERYGYAALVHDYLYSRPDQEWPRAEVDRVFLGLMRSLGVRWFERSAIFFAVSWFGGRARAAASGKALLDAATQAQLRERFRLGEVA
jgi:hypothetical protein